MRPRVERAIAAIAAVLGADELLLVAGIVLIVVSLWPVIGRVALLPAGLIIVWIALPARIGFISAGQTDATSRAKGSRDR